MEEMLGFALPREDSQRHSWQGTFETHRREITLQLPIHVNGEMATFF